MIESVRHTPGSLDCYENGWDGDHGVSHVYSRKGKRANHHGEFIPQLIAQPPSGVHERDLCRGTRRYDGTYQERARLQGAQINGEELISGPGGERYHQNGSEEVGHNPPVGEAPPSGPRRGIACRCVVSWFFRPSGVGGSLSPCPGLFRDPLRLGKTLVLMKDHGD